MHRFPSSRLCLPTRRAGASGPRSRRSLPTDRRPASSLAAGIPPHAGSSRATCRCRRRPRGAGRRSGNTNRDQLAATDRTGDDDVAPRGLGRGPRRHRTGTGPAGDTAVMAWTNGSGPRLIVLAVVAARACRPRTSATAAAGVAARRMGRRGVGPALPTRSGDPGNADDTRRLASRLPRVAVSSAGRRQKHTEILGLLRRRSPESFAGLAIPFGTLRPGPIRQRRLLRDEWPDALAAAKV